MSKPKFGGRDMLNISQGFADKRLVEHFKNANLPSLPISNVGRNRLISSFRNKYGANFRNVPGVGDIIKDFDNELDFRTNLLRAKKNGNSR